MIQQASERVDDQSDTSGRHEWRCSGALVLAKAHTSHTVARRDTRQEPADTNALHNSSSIAGSSTIQQCSVNIAHQLDIRPETVNPVILSSTTKHVVAGRVDHCCPLDVTTQFELKEGRFLNASAANTIKLKLRHQSGRGLDEGRERNGGSAQDQVQRGLRKTWALSCVGPAAENPEGRHHDRADGPEWVTDTGTETREQTMRSRRADVCVGRRDRRRSEESDDLTKHITCRTDLGAHTVSEDGEKSVLTSVERSKATTVSQSCRWTTRSCTTQLTRMPRSRSSRW